MAGSPLGPLTLAHRQGTQGVFVTRTLLRITGDLASAALLSQLVYWFDAGRSGGVRASVHIPRHKDPDGHVWVAKADGEWWDECGVTAKQARRVADQLVDAGLVAVQLAQFDGRPCRHWRIVSAALEEAIRADLADDFDPDHDSPSGQVVAPSGQVDSPKRANRFAEKGATITDELTDELTDDDRCDLTSIENSESVESNHVDESVDADAPTAAPKQITAKWRDDVVELGSWGDPVAAVFEMWIVAWGKNRGLVRLGPRRRKLIRETIKEYGRGDQCIGVAVCLDAVRGATLDAYYSERGREFADLEHLLRRGQKADTRNNVEYFAGLWREFVSTGVQPTTGQQMYPSAPTDLDPVLTGELIGFLRRGLPLVDVPRVADEIQRRVDQLGPLDREGIHDELTSGAFCEVNHIPRYVKTLIRRYAPVVDPELEAKNAANRAVWGEIGAVEQSALPAGRGS